MFRYNVNLDNYLIKVNNLVFNIYYVIFCAVVVVLGIDVRRFGLVLIDWWNWLSRLVGLLGGRSVACG
jgi:hypothetical protein